MDLHYNLTLFFKQSFIPVTSFSMHQNCLPQICFELFLYEETIVIQNSNLAALLLGRNLYGQEFYAFSIVVGWIVLVGLYLPKGVWHGYQQHKIKAFFTSLSPKTKSKFRTFLFLFILLILNLLNSKSANSNLVHESFYTSL